MLHSATAWVVASTIAYPTSNDERQHLSYVLHVKVFRSLFPNHYDLRLVAPERAGTFTQEKSHLKHPSFTYWLFSPYADPEQPAAENARRIRIANLGISILAVALFLVAGTGQLNTPSARAIYALVLVACPYLAVVGGTVNNDNLAILGGALAFLGIVRLARSGPGLAAGALAGAGVALSGLAKLTGALTVGFFVLFAHAALYGHWRQSGPDRNRHLFCLVMLGFLGAVPYLANVILHGYLLPTDDNVFWYSGPAIVPFEPLTYLVHFLTRLASTWGMYGVDAVSLTGLALVLALAIWAAAGKSDHGGTMEDIQNFRIVAAGLQSMGITLVINIVFIYYIHRKTGDLGNMLIRYFLPLWPLVALGAAIAASRVPVPALRKAVPALIVVLFLYAYTLPYVKGVFELQRADDFISVIQDLNMRKKP